MFKKRVTENKNVRFAVMLNKIYMYYEYNMIIIFACVTHKCNHHTRWLSCCLD